MAERIGTKAFIHQLALRMQTDDTVAAAWLEATVATLYAHFKAGQGVTLTVLGGFYQTPPDLVVKLQPIDIVDAILWPVLRPRVLYQREITG